MRNAKNILYISRGYLALAGLLLTGQYTVFCWGNDEK